MASNFTTFDIPPLPNYTLKPLPPLLPFISDSYLALALPILAYWAVSLLFHTIDTYDLFPHYRLHTPAELLKRNHAARWDVFRDVVLQQIIQTISGLIFEYFGPEAFCGQEDYDIAVWAQRIRLAQRAIPTLFGLFSIDSQALGHKYGGDTSVLTSILSGGSYPRLNQMITLDGERIIAPAFALWEINAAKSIYWIAIPALQFLAAIWILDSWQYWLHRTMHMNQYLYTKFHSRHHRLYVPYAYGALYNHPVEGLLLDTVGSGLAYLITGMTTRQAMLFFTACTIKTVDDHCGYALPWDPLQHITKNNAAYHDIHHQSWGIKSNFSQPFFTLWDGWMGTMWKGGDVKLRYEKSRKAAEEWWAEQRKFAEVEEQERKVKEKKNGSVVGSAPVLAKEDDAVPSVRRSPRKNVNSANGGETLKGLKERMSGSLPNGVPRVESNR
jgi:sphinganine C4-monooxygenase